MFALTLLILFILQMANSMIDTTPPCKELEECKKYMDDLYNSEAHDDNNFYQQAINSCTTAENLYELAKTTMYEKIKIALQNASKDTVLQAINDAVSWCEYWDNNGEKGIVESIEEYVDTYRSFAVEKKYGDYLHYFTLAEIAAPIDFLLTVEYILQPEPTITPPNPPPRQYEIKIDINKNTEEQFLSLNNVLSDFRSYSTLLRQPKIMNERAFKKFVAEVKDIWKLPDKSHVVIKSPTLHEKLSRGQISIKADGLTVSTRAMKLNELIEKSTNIFPNVLAAILWKNFGSKKTAEIFAGAQVTGNTCLERTIKANELFYSAAINITLSSDPKKFAVLSGALNESLSAIKRPLLDILNQEAQKYEKILPTIQKTEIAIAYHELNISNHVEDQLSKIGGESIENFFRLFHFRKLQGLIEGENKLSYIPFAEAVDSLSAIQTKRTETVGIEQLEIICIEVPLVLLQPQYFYPQLEEALKYGTVGTAIAREFYKIVWGSGEVPQCLGEKMPCDVEETFCDMNLCEMRNMDDLKTMEEKIKVDVGALQIAALDNNIQYKSETLKLASAFSQIMCQAEKLKDTSEEDREIHINAVVSFLPKYQDFITKNNCMYRTQCNILN